MKKIKQISLIIVLILSVSIAKSQTYVSGGIYNNTDWTLSNSPYFITGDIVLFPGKTLTIEPGVEIKLDGNYFLEIRGELISIGDIANRITYSYKNVTTNKSSWKGIRIINNQGGKASFEYSVFRNADEAVNTECCWNGGPVYYNHCEFSYNTIALSGYSGDDYLVDNCNFNNNTKAITRADKNVINSTFTNNQYGLYETERINVKKSTFSNNDVALYGGRGFIDSCLIENNNIGITPHYEGFELINNEILNNNIGAQLNGYENTQNYPAVKNNKICFNSIYNVENLDEINKDLTENCWCSNNQDTIDSKLFDGYDDISKGLFNFDIYALNCNTLLNRIIKVDLGTVYPNDSVDIIIIDSVLSINETENTSINLFPNPFSSHLKIDITRKNITFFSVTIYNSYGQQVFIEQYRNENIIIVPTENLENGIYIVSIKSDNYYNSTVILKN